MVKSLLLFLALIVLTLSYLVVGLLIKFYNRERNIKKKSERTIFITFLIISILLLSYGIKINTHFELVISYLFFIVLCIFGIYKGVLRGYEMDEQ